MNQRTICAKLKKREWENKYWWALKKSTGEYWMNYILYFCHSLSLCTLLMSMLCFMLRLENLCVNSPWEFFALVNNSWKKTALNSSLLSFFPLVQIQSLFSKETLFPSRRRMTREGNWDLRRSFARKTASFSLSLDVFHRMQRFQEFCFRTCGFFSIISFENNYFRPRFFCSISANPIYINFFLIISYALVFIIESVSVLRATWSPVWRLSRRSTTKWPTSVAYYIHTCVCTLYITEIE